MSQAGSWELGGHEVTFFFLVMTLLPQGCWPCAGLAVTQRVSFEMILFPACRHCVLDSLGVCTGASLWSNLRGGISAAAAPSPVAGSIQVGLSQILVPG